MSRNSPSHSTPSTPAPPSLSSLSISSPQSGLSIIGPYLVGGTIGAGIFAEVKLGSDEFRQKVAIKIFDKGTILAKGGVSVNAGPNSAANGSAGSSSASQQQAAQAALYQSHQFLQIEKEINSLRTCSHPNIVQFYDVLETESKVYLVMEHLPFGELYDHILSKGRLTEPEVGNLFNQVVSAIAYCHSRGIVHRDLKPENILLGGEGASIIKVVDFGLANYFDVHEDITVKSLRTQCGSPHYAAPEILTGQRYSGPLADVWSLGVLLYAMLCGSLPFNARSIPLLIKKITEGKFKIPKFLSPGAQHLIQTILQIVPENRPTIDAILNHPWMQQYKPGADGKPEEALKRPLSRPEIISPQSYTNARSSILMQQHPLKLRSTNPNSKYISVNANTPSGEGEETDSSSDTDEDDEDEEKAGSITIGGRRISSGSGGAHSKPSSKGRDSQLPPSDALSFQPESHLSRMLSEPNSGEFSSVTLGGTSVSNVGPSAIRPIPGTGANGTSRIDFASSPPAHYFGSGTSISSSSLALKKMLCPGCGKQLRPRVDDSGEFRLSSSLKPGSLYLPASSLGNGASSVLNGHDSNNNADLCQCAAQPKPVPSYSSEITNSDDHPPSVSSSSVVTAVNGSLAGGPLTPNAATKRKQTSPSKSAAALSPEETAALEERWKTAVEELFRAAEKGDADTVAKLILPRERAENWAKIHHSQENESHPPTANGHTANGTTNHTTSSSSSTPAPTTTSSSSSPPAVATSATPAPLPPLDVRITTIDSWNSLHFAAREGHEAVVALLLTCCHPLDINSRTKSGWTALMLAADRGHAGVVKLLLRYGAAIHVTNNDGKSAIFLARESGHPAIAQDLTNVSSRRHLKHTSGAGAAVEIGGHQVKELNHEFFRAAECGDLGKVRHLLTLGEEAKNIAEGKAVLDASTPVASRRQAQSLVQNGGEATNALLMPRYSVDILSRGIDNWTVLHFAARKGRTAVVSLLLDYDPPAEVNAVTKNNWSSLMLAADRGHAATCKVLLQRGADPNIVSNDGYTALSVAVENGWDEIVELLRDITTVTPEIKYANHLHLPKQSKSKIITPVTSPVAPR